MTVPQREYGTTQPLLLVMVGSVIFECQRKTCIVRKRTSAVNSARRTKAIGKVEALPPRTWKARVLL